MIRLYEKNEVNAKHNKRVLSECTKAEVTDEINYSYELDFEYPVEDTKSLSSYLIPGNIILAPSGDDRQDQYYVIRRVNPTLDNKSISVYAQHVFFAKMDGNVVLDTFVQDKTRKDALHQILNNTLNKHNFTVGDKDTNRSTNNLRVVRYSVLESLIGSKDNNIENRYGGELFLDNYKVNFVDRRGKDKNINVSYAKNITGATMTLEDLDLITEIVPVGSDGLMLPEKSVRASNFDINNPYTRIIEFSDIGVVEAETDDEGNVTNADEVCTKDQAYEKLRQACLDKFNKEHINEVSFNLELSFVELCDCISFDGNDYSEIFKDQRIYTGDTININIKPFGITQKGRVYKVVRDVLTGRLVSCEIGYKKDNIADTINKTNDKIADTKEELSEDIEDAKEEAADATNNLKLVMEKRDNEIELSVTNETEARVASYKVLDGKIEERVKEDDFEYFRSVTAKEFSQKISRGNDFSSEMKQNVDAFKFLFKGASDGETTIDSNGITVKCGGFKVVNSSGKTVMEFNSEGQCIAKYMSATDLNCVNTGKNSAFYHMLYNMDETSFNKLNATKLYISGQHIYDYIVDVLEDKGLL